VNYCFTSSPFAGSAFGSGSAVFPISFAAIEVGAASVAESFAGVFALAALSFGLSLNLIM